MAFPRLLSLTEKLTSIRRRNVYEFRAMVRKLWRESEANRDAASVRFWKSLAKDMEVPKEFELPPLLTNEQYAAYLVDSITTLPEVDRRLRVAEACVAAGISDTNHLQQLTYDPTPIFSSIRANPPEPRCGICGQSGPGRLFACEACVFKKVVCVFCDTHVDEQYGAGYGEKVLVLHGSVCGRGVRDPEALSCERCNAQCRGTVAEYMTKATEIVALCEGHLPHRTDLLCDRGRPMTLAFYRRILGR